MMKIAQAVEKMILRCQGNQYDICHFMKVWAYAKTIGELENLDAKTQQILEYAAIVHDIACPGLRKIHGNAPHPLQEKYGALQAREFYQGSGFDPAMLDRICYLVGHHHTYNGADGMDYQILLEADFLVNAAEQEKYLRSAQQFMENVFQTNTGISLLTEMYLKNFEK